MLDPAVAARFRRTVVTASNQTIVCHQTPMQYRFATPSDAMTLAQLNVQLIRDEGHVNPMTVAELAQRMDGWLADSYEAVLFEEDRSLVGYALYRREPEYVYLRQLFVVPGFRRRGVGRAALQWLSRNAWQGVGRLRIDVLVGNATAHAFWRSVDFRDYCITMEAQLSNDGAGTGLSPP